MDQPITHEMSRDQFAWGLSNGIAVLTISGVFWLSLAAWATSLGTCSWRCRPSSSSAGSSSGVACGFAVRFPQFSPSVLRAAPKGSVTRRIIIGFYAVTTAQWVSIIWIGVVCSVLSRPDLIWPLIGLVISLHFLPLGWLFGVRPYYLLAVLGTVITLFSILGLTAELRLVAVGLGLGLLMIAGAAYLIANAESMLGAGAPRPL